VFLRLTTRDTAAEHADEAREEVANG